jgi:pimeloyl-ACP methyl ester carboxylesterase
VACFIDSDRTDRAIALIRTAGNFVCDFYRPFASRIQHFLPARRRELALHRGENRTRAAVRRRAPQRHFTVCAMHDPSEEIKGITFIPTLEFEQRVQKKRYMALDPVWSWGATLGLVLCYAGGAATAVCYTHSATGWLALGLAPVLLFDRLTFRLLTATVPESRIFQLGIRAAYLVLGAYGLPLLQEGNISPLEGLYAGLVLTLVAFLFEYCIEWFFWLASWVGGGTPFHSKMGPVGTAVLAVLIAVPLVVLHPLMSIHPIRRVPFETPAKLGLAYEDVKLQTSDGLTLAAWYVPAERPRGTVVYCHGYGENRGQVVSMLELLHDLRLNVMAFDFRAHGHSAGHTATFGYREVHDVQAAWEYARKRGEGRPMFVVGISYGAAVALQALPQLPDVAGVWVDSSFGRLDSVMQRNFAFVPQISRKGLVSLASVLIWLDCGFWTDDVNPLERVGKLQKTPIYFCHSKADPNTDFAEARALYEAYHGPKWHFWVDDLTREGLTPATHREYYRRLHDFIQGHLVEYVNP